jgi:hypothetical protein
LRRSAFRGRNDLTVCVCRWCVICAPGVFAIVAFELFGWLPAAGYIAKQTARVRFAIENGDVSYSQTDETMTCKRAQDCFEIDRFFTRELFDSQVLGVPVTPDRKRVRTVWHA